MSEQVTQRPYSNANTTLQDILNQLFGLIPGLGPLLSQLLSPMVANYLVPPDSMLSQYIWGGNGPRSAAFAYMNTLQNRSWGTGASAIEDDAAYRVHMAYARTMNPEATPQELANLVANSMSNSFSIPSLIQMLLDPYKVSQGTAMARTVASSLQNRGAGFNIYGAEYAAQINSTLFGGRNMYYGKPGDTQGKDIEGILNEILKDPSQYGNMSMADVMTVARELSTTRNYSTGSGKDMRFDSEGFKRDVQNLSKALEPWKEIFGKDIPQLMGQLEALTGRSVGSQASTLHNTALNLMSTLHVTGAKIQHIAAYRDAIAPALMDPTQTNRSILGAHNVATDMVLGLSNISVKSLTTQELQQIGGVFYTGTAKSQFADSFALAYAAWLDKQNAADRKTYTEDPEKGREAFYTAYQAERRNKNHQTALEALAGKSLRDLEMYRYTDGFLNMVDSGIGGRVSREEVLNQSADVVKRYLTSNNITIGDDQSIREFLALSRSEKIEKLVANKMGTEEATRHVAAIEQTFGSAFRYISGHNTSDVGVQALQATAMNEQKQRRLAEQHKTFLETAGKMSSVSGLEGVIRKLYESDGRTNLSAAIKEYAGGNDYTRIALEAMAADSGDNLEKLLKIEKEPEDKKSPEYQQWKANKDTLTRYTRAVNFMNNNFAELATTYNLIHDNLIRERGKTESVDEYKRRRANALNQFAMLDQIDRKALAGMAKDDRDKLAKTVVDISADTSLNDKEKLDKLKDHVLDSGFKRFKARVDSDNSTNPQYKDYLRDIEVFMKANTSTSKEELLKNWENTWKSKWISDNHGQEASWDDKTSKAGKDWKAERARFEGVLKQLGDIDKADPMKSIVDAIGKLVNFVEAIKVKVTGSSQ